jgi:hypothetical protein
MWLCIVSVKLLSNGRGLRYKNNHIHTYIHTMLESALCRGTESACVESSILVSLINMPVSVLYHPKLL